MGAQSNPSRPHSASHAGQALPLQSRASGSVGSNGRQPGGIPSMRQMGRTSSGMSVPTSTFSASRILCTQQQPGELGLSDTVHPPEQGEMFESAPAVSAPRRTERLDPARSEQRQQQRQRQQQLPVRGTYRRPSTVGSSPSSSLDGFSSCEPLLPPRSTLSRQYCYIGQYSQARVLRLSGSSLIA